MNQKTFLERLATLAKVCDFQLSPDLVRLYDIALKRFGYDKAVLALEKVIVERRGQDRMPSIGDLMRILCPVEEDSDTAVEVAGRIIQAVRQFGYSLADEAKVFLGEVGWHVVNRNGGWTAICETMREKDLGVWKAQLREMASASLKRSRLGKLNTAPSFPTPEAPERLKSLVADIAKPVAKPKEPI